MAVPLKLRVLVSRKCESRIFTLATGDTDGDGIDEIVVGLENANLCIFKYEKSELKEWKKRLLMYIDQIVIEDVDKDHFNEILVVSGSSLMIYKFSEPDYNKVWDFKASAHITSLAVGDVNNDRKTELVLGTDDGDLIVFAQGEEPYEFKPVWKKKFEGEVLVSLADLDANKLNELVVCNNNAIHVFRIVDKYPKKESWSETFRPYIKRIHLFDVNSDDKAEMFLGFENGDLCVFSHKDGDYFSEDKKYAFHDIVSTISSGQFRNKKVVIAGSYDKTIRAFQDVELFKIEVENKIYAAALADIDHDGITEIVLAVNNTLFIFKEDILLTFEMDYPSSIMADEELVIRYYIKNNSEFPIVSLDFSNLEWIPKVLSLKESLKPGIPLIEGNSAREVILRFKPSVVEKVIPVIFKSFKIQFQLNNQLQSQLISEMRINLLPPFNTIAQHIIAFCKNLKGTKVPLKSLEKIISKELGPVGSIERIISRLLDENILKGTLTDNALYIQDVRPLPTTPSGPLPPEQKSISPELLSIAVKKAILLKKRTSLSELAVQFNKDTKTIEEIIQKLKTNFEVTGILIPNEEFYYLTLDEVNLIIDVITKASGFITLPELVERFELSEKELKVLLNDLVALGKVYGQLISKDNVNRFITAEALSKMLSKVLADQGKIDILPYSKQTNIASELIREAVRILLDSHFPGYYTFDGKIFYSEAQLAKELISLLQNAETTSIGLASLAKQFQISRDIITQTLTNLINRNVINGYISENTLYLKSYEEEKLRDLFEKYNDALNLIHILVIHRDSGVAIFSGSYTLEKIDSSLVSGFLHAITAFGSELSGMEGSLRLLEYRGFRISVQEGESIRAALILKEDPSRRLLEILKHFVRFFDTKYKSALQNFKGAVDIFSDANTLVDDFFEISLSFLHEIQEKEVFKNRERLSANELAVINMARSLGRQFLLSNLLEKVSKELLISQLEAFSMIYNLREKKIFNIITEERKYCPNCGSLIPKLALTCPHCLKPTEETKG
jgi:hypothetical protein